MALGTNKYVVTHRNNDFTVLGEVVAQDLNFGLSLNGVGYINYSIPDTSPLTPTTTPVNQWNHGLNRSQP